MQKILITGASGFLGTKLKSVLGSSYEVIGTYQNRSKSDLHQLDITNSTAVSAFVELHNPDIIIHAAALADPDYCEKNKELAERINVIGTKNVVNACKSRKLIFISTNYVFDGERGNYVESDPCNPINVYGATKYRAEQEIKHLDESLILRLPMLYGYNGQGLPNGFFSKIIKGQPLNLDNVTLRQPLLADDVGAAINILIMESFSGVFHLAGPNRLPKYELGLALERAIRQESLLTPCTLEEPIVKRPENASLETSKARRIGIYFHSIKESVEIIRKQYQNA